MFGKRFSRRLRESAGYSVVEAMTVVGAMGIVAAVATPSVLHFQAAHQVQSAASQVGGMLQRVRARAVAEATPYLVVFQREEVANGERSAFALIVRDNDRSYSVTPPDQVETFTLDEVRPKVRQYGETEGEPLIYEEMVPVPDLTTSTRTSNSGPGSMNSGSGSSGSGSSGSGSSGSGSGSTTSTITTVIEPVSTTATHGTTFPVSEDTGEPMIAFNERGIPVSPDSPQQWGSGAGAVYLTDNESTVYAAVVSPLGEVSLARYDGKTATWK